MHSLTVAGGFFSCFTYWMSAGLSVSRADRASRRIGSALASSASQSLLMAPAAAAAADATSSSFCTTAFFGSTTSRFSRSIFFISSSTSATVLMSCGFSASKSRCMPATCSAEDMSFSRPTA